MPRLRSGRFCFWGDPRLRGGGPPAGGHGMPCPYKERTHPSCPALTRWAKPWRAYGARRKEEIQGEERARGAVPPRCALRRSKKASEKNFSKRRRRVTFLAQPVRVGLRSKKMMSTVGAAPSRKHIWDRIPPHVFSIRPRTLRRNFSSCGVLPGFVYSDQRRE